MTELTRDSQAASEPQVRSSAWLGRGGVPGPALWRICSVAAWIIGWIEIFQGNQPIAWFAAGLSAGLKADSLKRPNAEVSHSHGERGEAQERK